MFAWIRRLLWLALLAGAGAAVATKLRGDDADDRLAVWPPLPGGDPGAEGRAAASAPTSTPATVAAAVAAPVADTATIVDAVPTDEPDDPSTWVVPDDDGTCPLSHPVKANDNSGIFHVPGGRFYDRTKAERCYRTADEALADGYRAAKS